MTNEEKIWKAFRDFDGCSRAIARMRPKLSEPGRKWASLSLGKSGGYRFDARWNGGQIIKIYYTMPGMRQGRYLGVCNGVIALRKSEFPVVPEVILVGA